jgi:hypothetical protein
VVGAVRHKIGKKKPQMATDKCVSINRESPYPVFICGHLWFQPFSDWLIPKRR